MKWLPNIYLAVWLFLAVFALEGSSSFISDIFFSDAHAYKNGSGVILKINYSKSRQTSPETISIKTDDEVLNFSIFLKVDQKDFLMKSKGERVTFLYLEKPGIMKSSKEKIFYICRNNGNCLSFFKPKTGGFYFAYGIFSTVLFLISIRFIFSNCYFWLRKLTK